MPGRFTRAALAIVLALSGCVDSTTIPRPTASLVIHAVLDMGSRDQLVLLERSRAGVPIPNGSSSFVQNAIPILGARVTITGPDGVVMSAREDRLSDSARAVKGVYRISLDQYGATLVQGGRYTLYVRTDLGEEASGSTTMPRAAAAAPSTPESFAPSSDTLRLTWPRVDGAYTYEVRMQSSQRSNPYVIFADSGMTFPGRARSLDDEVLFVSPSTVQVVVSAVDANYYEYHRQLSDIFLGAPPTRLTGAIGVFGAIVPIAVRRLSVR